MRDLAIPKTGKGGSGKRRARDETVDRRRKANSGVWRGVRRGQMKGRDAADRVLAIAKLERASVVFCDLSRENEPDP